MLRGGETMFCPNCGHKVEGEEKFCTQCGAPLGGAVGVKKTSSSSLPKILGIAGGVVAVVVIIALLLGGLGGTGGPEQTIRAFYRAAERLDASGQVALFAEEYRWLWTGLHSTYAQIDSFSISDLTITIDSQTQDTAQGVAYYDYKLKLKDGSTGQKEDQVDVFTLVRRDNKWFISGTSFLSSD